MRYCKSQWTWSLSWPHRARTDVRALWLPACAPSASPPFQLTMTIRTTTACCWQVSHHNVHYFDPLHSSMHVSHLTQRPSNLLPNPWDLEHRAGDVQFSWWRSLQMLAWERGRRSSWCCIVCYTKRCSQFKFMFMLIACEELSQLVTSDSLRAPTCRIFQIYFVPLTCNKNFPGFPLAPSLALSHSVFPINISLEQQQPHGNSISNGY